MPDKYFESLKQTPTSSTVTLSECNSRPQIQLPLDHNVSLEERSGDGKEIVVRMNTTLYRRFQRVCADADQTVFTGLTGVLFLLLSEICEISLIEAGILVSTRDIRRQYGMAGCFVHVESVTLDFTRLSTFQEIIQEIGRQIDDLTTGAKHGTLVGGGKFPIMISMVRDSSTQLNPPSKINVRYERRRRTQAECDLHVFFYDHKDNIEIVFNYDSDILTESTVLTWANAFVHQIEDICHSLINFDQTLRNINKNKNYDKELPVIDCYLQHIGLAAHELDIGLLRLASKGFIIQGKPWTDHKAGVSMALAGNPEQLQLEVVAPIREDAPCVGPLTRDGEGPYHCCWRIGNLDLLLEAMNRHNIKHTVIIKDGISNLFPDEIITFLIVDGLGLIELLSGGKTDYRSRKGEQHFHSVHLKFESSDIYNAGRFLQLIGYQRLNILAQYDKGTTWVEKDTKYVFHLSTLDSDQLSILDRIEIQIAKDLTTENSLIVNNSTIAGTVTSWWPRISISI
jgi:methylmalonyl-CoA/ethylmalonyl-CoA epimerase